MRRKRNEALVELQAPGVLQDALRDLGVSKATAQRLAIAYPDGRGLENAAPSALRELGATAPQAKRVHAAFSVVRVCDDACDARVHDVSLTSPGDVVKMLRSKIGRKEQEYFAVVLLDSRQKVTDILGVAVGSLAQVEVHPREVFREAIRRATHSIIVAHNHPSGSAEPSAADVDLTARLVQVGRTVGIPVLDSFVIARSSYVSMAQRGMLEHVVSMAAEPNPKKPVRLTGRGLVINPIKGMPGGSVSGCIKQVKKRRGKKKISDPGAYCAAIADRIEPGWRSKNPPSNSRVQRLARRMANGGG